MTDFNNQTEDYISLASIKNAVRDILRGIFSFFSFIFEAIRSNKFLFFGTVAVAVLLAVLYSLVKSSFFETEMIVQQNTMPRKAYGEIIYNLDNLTTSHSYSDLASQLKINRKDAAQIISMIPLSLTNDPLSRDTVTLIGLPLKIHVKVRNNRILPGLQTALINYLNNNAYSRNLRESQKMIYAQKLEFIQFEQRKLDSLKEIYNRSLATMKLPTTFYNNGLNPAEIYRYSWDLASQKEVILRWLNTESNGVVLIDGFKIPENPESDTKAKIVVLGLLYGLGIGLILSILVAVKRKLD
jgi:hypothetical protein